MPCNGPLYEGMSQWDRQAKVHEELIEAEKALNDSISSLFIYAKHCQGTASRDMVQYWRELTDVITAATSALEASGCDFEMRQLLQAAINERNMKRDGGRRVKREPLSGFERGREARRTSRRKERSFCTSS